LQVDPAQLEDRVVDARLLGTRDQRRDVEGAGVLDGGALRPDLELDRAVQRGAATEGGQQVLQQVARRRLAGAADDGVRAPGVLGAGLDRHGRESTRSGPGPGAAVAPSSIGQPSAPDGVSGYGEAGSSDGRTPRSGSANAATSRNTGAATVPPKKPDVGL